MADNIAEIGTLRDHGTIFAWETSTQGDLVTAQDNEIGHWYADQVWTQTLLFTALGSTTSALYHRTLMAGPGQEYDPDADTGLMWRAGTAGTKATIAEDHFQLGPGIGFDHTHNGSSSGAKIVMNLTGSDLLIERCYLVTRNDGTYDNQSWMFNFGSSASNTQVRNCIIKAEAGTIGTPDYGIIAGSAVNDLKIYNNTIYNLSVDGLRLAAGTGHDVRNNLILESTSQDYDWGSATYTDRDHNGASDTTPVGPNSESSLVHTDEWTDPDNADFSLKAGATAIGAGEDLSGTFTDDYHGDTRTTWDMGAILKAAGGPAPIEPPTGDLDTEGIAPTLTGDASTSPPTGDLDTEGVVPVVTSGPPPITPPTGDLDTEGVTPALSGDASTSPPTGDLDTEGVTPALSGAALVEPPTGDLDTEGVVPLVAEGSVPITPPTGDLATEGVAPAVSGGGLIQPPTADLATGAPVPGVFCGPIDPPTGDLDTEGVIPTVSAGLTIAVPVADLDTEGVAPTHNLVQAVPFRWKEQQLLNARAARDAFGQDVRYFPGGVAASGYDVVGIFRDDWTTVDPDTGVELNSQDPNFRFVIPDLGAWPVPFVDMLRGRDGRIMRVIEARKSGCNVDCLVRHEGALT